MTGRIGRLHEEEPFGTPLPVAQRYAWAEHADIAAALTRFCEIIGDGDPAEIEALSKQRRHVFQLKNFEARLERLKPHPSQDSNGAALRRFDAAQALFEMAPDRFDRGAVYPPLVARVMGRAAEALYELGQAQCARLAELARELSGWAKQREFKHVAVIEAPLGNCVPSAVIAAALDAQGVRAVLVEWGCPRNDKGLSGHTVRKSAQRLASNAAVAAADVVLFVDDALTGTRFMKMARELRRAVGPERFAGIAMRFAFAREAARCPFMQRDLSDVAEWAAEAGLSQGVIDFPPLPVFVIDAGERAYFESAVLWGDHDLVAGKRKVNLLFAQLDQFERIAKDLVSSSSRYRPVLERLWRREDTGRQFIARPGLIDEIYLKLGAEIDVDALFGSVRAVAREAFADDYLGVAPAPSEAEIRARVEWLGNAVLREASRTLETNHAGLLRNAIHDISASGAAEADLAANRDHDYGHYTVAWAPDLLELHRTLCRLILRHV